jgi:hypothetical protein
VPHGDQELASDGHNGLVLAQTRFEASQTFLPKGMGASCRVSNFDHGGTDVTAAGFGDTTGATGLAAVMDAST